MSTMGKVALNQVRTGRAVDESVGENQAVWTIQGRNGSFRFQVDVIDARVAYGRLELLVRTNMGDEVWANEKSLQKKSDWILEELEKLNTDYAKLQVD